jgi:FMN reductase
LDFALKPVLAALGARHILAGVFAADAQLPRTSSGAFEFDTELRTRLDRSVAELAVAVSPVGSIAAE